MKSYTDLEQSKKLAEILPIESADMFYRDDTGIDVKLMWEHNAPKVSYPCWSLTALLEQIPYEQCDDDCKSLYLQIYKDNDLYQLIYADPYGDFDSIETDRYEHFVDACYEMILELHKQNLI